MNDTIIQKNPKDLKPDPNQPRTRFDEEAIEKIAQTYKNQGLIEPIEIDENDMIITGELRWRASKLAKLKQISCIVKNGLSPKDRFERQVVENLHHNLLEDEDKENAIRKLWEDGKYTSEAELAYAIGMTEEQTKHIINLKKIRKNLGITEVSKFSSATLKHIQSLTIEEQKKIIQKIKVGQLKQGQELRELVVEVKKLPNDLKESVLSIDNPIDLKMAKTIAEFPEEEQRQEMVREVKKYHRYAEESIKYHLDIVEGKIPEKRILEDPLTRKIEYMLKLKFNIFNRFNRKYIETIESQEFRVNAIGMMREIYYYLKEELERLGDIAPQKVIEVKGVKM